MPRHCLSGKGDGELGMCNELVSWRRINFSGGLGLPGHLPFMAGGQWPGCVADSLMLVTEASD